MSNMILNSDKKEVYTNGHGCYLRIGENSFLYSEILPVILHYIKGGIFGHNLSTEKRHKVPGLMYLNENELKAIENFITSVGSLKKKVFENRNIGFTEHAKERVRTVVCKSEQRKNKKLVLRRN